MSLAARWCVLASAAIGVLAAGIRSVTDDVTPLLALVAGVRAGRPRVPGDHRHGRGARGAALLGRVPGLVRR